MPYRRPIRRASSIQPSRWGSALLACLAVSLATAPAAAQHSTHSVTGFDGRFPSTREWSEILRASSDGFLEARVEYRRAQEQLDAGIEETALRHLQAATTADPRYAQPHFTRARIDLLAGRVTAVGQWVEGQIDRMTSYLGQARLAANVLLGIDLILAALLVWILAISYLRYAPFWKHQLASRLDPKSHAQGASRFLWIVVFSPLALGLGLIPTMTMVIPALWLYGQRRVRWVLGILVGWFAVQGLYPAPFGAVLAVLDPASRPSLVARAAYESPSPYLAGQIDAALATAPRNADLHFARGLVQARAGRFASSSESFLQSLKLRPDHAACTNNLANNHFYEGDVDRAVSGYQQSAVLDPHAGGTHHNLSQAFIRKLYLKEGGEEMQRAVRLGFHASNQREPLPPGAVYYRGPTPGELWRLAWADRMRVAPHDLLVRHQSWLGVPPDHVGIWLASSLVLALILGLMLQRGRLVFECANCGKLACQHCQGEHEGAILCSGCAANARRARSELVLTTLLRNRRVEAEIAFHNRLRRLDAWCFGAGRIYNGLDRGPLISGLVFSMLVVGAVVTMPLVQDFWENPPVVTWSFARLASLAGLLLLGLFHRVGRVPFRRRKLHLHPSNLVSLVDLIEGLPKQRKLGA